MTINTYMKNLIYPIASRYFFKALVIEGTVKGTDRTMKCLFVGNSNLMKYLSPRTYDSIPVIKQRWIIFAPALKNSLKKLLFSNEICIANLPKRMDHQISKLFNFKCQEYIRQIINTSGSINDIRSAFHHGKKQLSNKIEKLQIFNYRISQNSQDFDKFYYRMFRPHIQNQYGHLADIDSYTNMKKYFDKGVIIFVTENNCDIAGALLVSKGDFLQFRRSGVYDGSEKLIKIGAGSAIYYFSILYAVKNKFKILDTMNSRSLLNDGVYITKKEWGAEVLPDSTSNRYVYLFATKHTPEVLEFFRLNPFIIHTVNGLRGLVVLPEGNRDKQTNATQQQEFVQRYYSPGMSGMTLLTEKGQISIPLPCKKK